MGCAGTKINQKNVNGENSLTIYKQNVSIKSKVTNKVLDVCQDNDAFGCLIIYEDYQQDNQRFDILKSGSNGYFLRCRKSQKFLTVGSNSQKNYAPIFEEPMSKVVGQTFKLQFIKPNECYIHTFCGKVLDLGDKKTSNGTRVVQFDFTKQVRQIWIIIQ